MLIHASPQSDRIRADGAGGSSSVRPGSDYPLDKDSAVQSKKDSTRLREWLAGEIRHRVQRIEAISLGQPAVAALLLVKLDNSVASGALSAAILKEQNTRALLLHELAGMRKALSAYATGKLTDCELANCLEQHGASLSSHIALRKGRLIYSASIEQFRALLTDEMASLTDRHDSVVPMATRSLLRERADRIKSELPPLETQMFEANRGLVGFALKRFRISRQEHLELEPVAHTTLLRCIREFRPEFGNTFATYAFTALRNEIASELDAIRSRYRIKVPGVASEGAVSLLSLNRPIAGSDSTELMAFVADKMSADPQALVADQDERLATQSLVHAALQQISPLHQRALRSYYQLDAQATSTLSSVAIELGVTVSQARVLVNAGKRSLLKVIIQSADGMRALKELNLLNEEHPEKMRSIERKASTADEPEERTMQEDVRGLARRKGAELNSHRGVLAPPDAGEGSPSSQTGSPPQPQVVAPPPEVNLKTSFKQLASAVAELGPKPNLKAGDELWGVTELYYQRLREARIAGRSPDGGASVLAAQVREYKELIESAQRTLCRAWPLGHTEETHGFRLEGEMLQMKKDPTSAHIARVLDATTAYIRSLPKQ